MSLPSLARKYGSHTQSPSTGVTWPEIPARLQARLTAEQAATVLGFTPNDIAVLVSVGLLKPLGNPRQQSVKHFAAFYIENCARDLKWLEEATQAIYDYHNAKNARKTIYLAKQQTAIAA